MLQRYGLTYLPEAHCYLRKGKKRIDLIRSSGVRAEPITAFVHEEEIAPEQITHNQISMHKNFLQKWRSHTADLRGLSLAAEVWRIREECIASLRGISTSRPT